MTTGGIDGHAAVADAALDVIITIVHQKRIVEFNALAEDTFGWRRDAACRRLVAEAQWCFGGVPGSARIFGAGAFFFDGAGFDPIASPSRPTLSA